MRGACFIFILLLCVLSVNSQISIAGAKISTASGAIVQETGSATLEFNNSGLSFAAGDIIKLVLVTGSSMASSTPTCSVNFSLFTISSCAYSSATNTLTITIGTATTSTLPVLITTNNFVYPTSALTSWPSSGGASLTVTSSGGTSKGIASNIKITGTSAGATTSITINHDSSKPNVGETDVTLFFSITVPHIVPVDGYLTVFFPTQPVSGDHVVSSPACTQSGGTLSSSLS